jgi:hypothetical protein
MSCRVKKIKVKFVGLCATVLTISTNFVSILFIKGFYTCGLLIERVNKLVITVIFTNFLNTFTDPKQDLFLSSTRVSHVMLITNQGEEIRSF